jgi:hypothetical protein
LRLEKGPQNPCRRWHEPARHARAHAKCVGGGFGERRKRRSGHYPSALHLKGTPAHFVPSQLIAKARWDGVSSCTTAAQASFTLTNKKGKAQTITFSGAASGKLSVPAHKKNWFFCVSKGATGKLVGKLKDGKKLIVHLQ